MTPKLSPPRGPLVATYRPRQEFLDEFAASLVGMTQADITVIGATAVYGSWTADDHVYVDLHFADPPPGHDTWQVDALLEVLMDTRRRAAAAGIEEFIDVGFTGGRDDEDEDEDEDEPMPSLAPHAAPATRPTDWSERG